MSSPDAPATRAVDISSAVDCVDSADCQSKLDNSSFACGNETPTFDDKANWPALDFAAESRPSLGWFLWCQKEILVTDSVGSSAADAADLQKANDQSLRDSKKSARLTSVAACVTAVNNVASLTPTQIKDCLNILIKHNFESAIDPADL